MYDIRVSKSVYLHIFIAIFATVFLIYTFNPHIGYLTDSIRYYLLGQSVASGNGLVRVWEAGWPVDTLSSPLYPFLIAAISTLGIESLLFIKLMNGIFFIGLAVLTYRIFIKFELQPEIAFLCSLLVSVNFELLRHASLMLTEIPYTLLSLLCLNFALKADQIENKFPETNFWLAIIFAIAAFYTRTIGIALIGSIILNEAIKRRWRKLMILTAILIGVIFPWILNSSKQDGLTHFAIITSDEKLFPLLSPASISDYALRIYNNLLQYVSYEIPYSILRSSSYLIGDNLLIGLFIGSIIMAITIFGFIKLKNGRIFTAAYVMFYSCILLIFPSVFSGARLFLPLIPIIIGLFISGVFEIIPKKKFKYNLNLIYLFILCLILINAFSLKYLHDIANKPPSPQRIRFAQSAAWSANNLPKDAIVATVVGEHFFLYSMRQTIALTPYSDADDFLNYLIYSGVTHILIDELSWNLSSKISFKSKNFVEPLIKINPEKFKEVYRSEEGDTYILMIQPE